MNFNDKKKQAAQSMDTDTLNFLREVKEKFGTPKTIEYINKTTAFRIDNIKQSITITETL